jgi:hypothetical protein
MGDNEAVLSQMGIKYKNQQCQDRGDEVGGLSAPGKYQQIII